VDIVKTRIIKDLILHYYSADLLSNYVVYVAKHALLERLPSIATSTGTSTGSTIGSYPSFNLIIRVDVAAVEVL
jgi:hypothetical protein